MEADLISSDVCLMRAEVLNAGLVEMCKIIEVADIPRQLPGDGRSPFEIAKDIPERHNPVYAGFYRYNINNRPPNAGFRYYSDDAGLPSVACASESTTPSPSTSASANATKNGALGGSTVEPPDNSPAVGSGAQSTVTMGNTLVNPPVHSPAVGSGAVSTVAIENALSRSQNGSSGALSSIPEPRPRAGPSRSQADGSGFGSSSFRTDSRSRSAFRPSTKGTRSPKRSGRGKGSRNRGTPTVGDDGRIPCGTHISSRTRYSGPGFKVCEDNYLDLCEKFCKPVEDVCFDDDEAENAKKEDENKDQK